MYIYSSIGLWKYLLYPIDESNKVNKMIMAIITTATGGLFFIFSIITWKFPRWTICIEYLLHITNAGKVFIHTLAEYLNDELSLVNRNIKTLMCLKIRKPGMMYR
jgi:hypothetical protein